MSQVIDNGERVTRKPHDCAYCDIEIPAGARVAWWKWADDGRIETSYGHLECRDADRWDAARFGRIDDDELTDPAEFRREVLPEFRQHLAATAAELIAARSQVGGEV